MVLDAVIVQKSSQEPLALGNLTSYHSSLDLSPLGHPGLRLLGQQVCPGTSEASKGEVSMHFVKLISNLVRLNTTELSLERNEQARVFGKEPKPKDKMQRV